MPAPVHVAVGVIRKGEQVLVARRSLHVHQGGLLEFPGGKVEAGETVTAALIRELHEELGIVVFQDGLRSLLQIPFQYADKQVLLDVLEVCAYSGNPVGREGQPLFWRKWHELDPADFPAANRPILAALGLPEIWMISGSFENSAQALERLQQSLAVDALGLVTLRAPWLDAEDYRALATAAFAICQAASVRLLLHGNPAFWHGLACDGYHLPQSVAAHQVPLSLVEGKLLAVSCHDRAELEHAVQVLHADLVTLSPVFPSRSHPEAPALGWTEFQRLGFGAGASVYALGGMTLADLSLARRYGARGIAAIGACWPY